MKTNIGSALSNIANGFAASYSTALTQLRGFSSDKTNEPAKPMVNTPIAAPTAQAALQASEVEQSLAADSKLNVVA
jgi:hypothetical protein